MLESLETKALIEGALFSTITVILTLISFYLPLGAIMFFLLPVPIVVLSVRQGSKVSILSTILTAILLGILLNPLMILVVLFSFGLVGVVLGTAFEEEFSPFKIIAIVIIASILSTILIVGVNFYLLNFNPLDTMNSALEQYKNLNLDQGTRQQVEKIVTDMKEMIKTLLPALLITASSINGLINYYISLAVLRKLDYEYERPLSFIKWRFPKYLIWGYLLGVIFINTTIGQNVYFLFNFVFLIQGLAVAAYYLKGFNISSVIQKVILVILVILPFNQILAFLGIFDLWFDYRKLEES